MNILQVIPELDAGGAERTTIEIAEAVTAAGGRALVASQGGRLERELSAAGGELVHLPVKSKNPWTIWRNAARLARLIREHEIDLIHARSRAPAWSAFWAAKRTGAAFVTTYHGTYNARSGLKRRYNSIMARGDRVIANSHFIGEHVTREHGVPADRLAVIPRGVDLARFDPARINQRAVQTLRAKWRVEPEQILILLPARLTRWKGQEHAIAALALIADQTSNAVLVCAGDAQGRSDYAETLRTKAEAAGIALRLPGHVEDMATAYAAADLVLNPSIEPEAFGRSAAEAQALGRPVIVADHGGAREVVEHAVTGWRAPPGDDQVLADTIATALGQTPGARDTMARAARERVTDMFSKRALQEKTLRVYRELLDCRS
ncbi:glycosyl transferase [Marinicauda pacifica]|uniref:Glycosyltransferase n=1 Tax=Marinicauda pacifica TaxID=1133559 RepID=A0A4S2HCB5_9PROT|nr:glycosyltransferase family 4 protein [Marinicauda pacifica]TGY93308.1 glycosyltransferase [Marinicauda pacifica]GGE44648.1 glycosyl transferase [Marinicauda pacifica]